MSAATSYDVIVLGAGGAGLMCGGVAGQRGKSVLVLDHRKAPGEKIRISGGGRCNFTNLYTAPENFLSQNPHFVKSALKRYDQHDFIALVERHGIAWHEKTLGQLFCDESARQVIQMLLDECEAGGAQVKLNTEIASVSHADGLFTVATSAGEFTARALVVATGGKSIPKMGATGFGYDLAAQFGLKVVEPRAGLVPLTFSDDLKATYKPLSGISVDADVAAGGAAFSEGLLFTHRGLSGPSILQISSYWREGEEIEANLARRVDVLAHLKAARSAAPRQEVGTAIAAILPKRLADVIAADLADLPPRLADCSNAQLERAAARVTAWRVRPTGTEGYRTAEVTLGGVDTDELSSKTMEAKRVPGLYFIGEVVDVTGHLGGFNFQWAWSSAVAAGRALGERD